MRSQSSLFGGHSKSIFWLTGILFAVWVVARTNTIGAFLTFCLSGIVPGTNYVVPPSVVMLLSAIGCTLCLLVFLGRLYAQHSKRRSGYVWKKQHEPIYASANRKARKAGPIHTWAGTNTDYSMIERQDRKQALRSFTTALRIKLAMASWQRHAYDQIGENSLFINEIIKRTAASMLVMTARAVIISVVLLGILFRLIVGVFTALLDGARSIWSAVESRLWQTDAWLENRFAVVMAHAKKPVNKFLRNHEIFMTTQHVFKEIHRNVLNTPHSTPNESIADQPAEATKQ